MNESGERFSDLNIPEILKTNLRKMGLETLTPIQIATIRPALNGRDLLGSSQTGTGKTAAYGIPMLAWLYANPGRQALVLVPTRELATQIYKVLRKMAKGLKIKGSLILGGESFARQKNEIEGDADFIVATPGRLNDHLESSPNGAFNLSRVSLFVLDEVDLMMDLGFAPQVKAIAKSLPKARQTLFFSATLPGAILSLTESLLKNPARATVGLTTKPVSDIAHVNRKVNKDKKPELLLSECRDRKGPILVFTRTKLGTETLANLLSRDGQSVDFLHGERTQRQRKEALEGFRTGKFRILVATDVAARGLDIRGIEHIVNYSLPQTREEYIHRVGRAGRHGKKGTSVNFITPRDKNTLRTIGGTIGMAEPPKAIAPRRAPRPSSIPVAKPFFPRAGGGRKGRKGKPGFRSPSHR